jgi:hypothetical protein
MKGASKSRTSTQTAEKEIRRPNIDDMSYKKLVLKLRRFLADIFKDSDGNKDPNITKSVVKRLKVRQNARLVSSSRKRELVVRGRKIFCLANLTFCSRILNPAFIIVLYSVCKRVYFRIFLSSFLG